MHADILQRHFLIAFKLRQLAIYPRVLYGKPWNKVFTRVSAQRASTVFISSIIVFLFIQRDVGARQEQTMARGPRKANQPEDHGCRPLERVLLATVSVAKRAKMCLKLHDWLA